MEGQSARARIRGFHDSQTETVFTDQSYDYCQYEPAENVDAPRAPLFCMGNWGNEQGLRHRLAFAVAGYSSFWLIGRDVRVTALVGVNYIIICNMYPDGGGVYASVRHRSEVISIVARSAGGGYLVTAAISGLSAFNIGAAAP